MPRRANGEAGFVITLELILIFTILGIGILAGIIAVRNALFVWAIKQRAQTVWVYDNAGIPLGPARDFDEHEAPRLFYIDRNVEWPAGGGVDHNYRAFVGVRDDRFTGRQRIFYDQLGCLGTACITAHSDEDADNAGVGTIVGTFEDGSATLISLALPIRNAGGQGYLYALQDGPTYGVGADVDQTFNSLRLPGTLYRQTDEDCITAEDQQIRSVWTSQSVVSGESCVNLPQGLVVEGANCPSGQVPNTDPEYGTPCKEQNNTSPLCQVSYLCTGGDAAGFPCEEDAQCTVPVICSSPNAPPCCATNTCVGGTCDNNSDADLTCSCPGWGTPQVGDDWVPTGSNCCPPGTDPQMAGGGVGVICNIITTDVFFEAEPVQIDTVDGLVNIFSLTTPPFHVNLPPSPSDFTFLAPGANEGDPGTDTGIPYSPTDFVFNGEPDGE